MACRNCRFYAERARAARGCTKAKSIRGPTLQRCRETPVCRSATIAAKTKMTLSTLPIKFVKAHACGNDFLILEEAAAGGAPAELGRGAGSRQNRIGGD